MKLTTPRTLLVAAFAFACGAPAPAQTPTGRNIIIFVADGLRAGSVTASNAPTLYSVRTQGVNFANSHSLFPTFTTPNASAIATGHQLGDTGDFSNTIYSGYPIFNTGNFGKTAGTVTPFVENNQVLGDLDDHYNGNYLTEESLLALARLHGYNTASVGKVGPVAIQDVTQLQPVAQQFTIPDTAFVDDATGGSAGIPLRSDIAAALTAAGLPLIAPNRSNGCGTTDQCNNGYSGNNTTPGTTSPNTVQQQYFADVLTKALLPAFGVAKPFAVVFWSRDPDGTQHNQGDSLNTLTPGINGPTSLAAVRNADGNLAQIMAYINANPALAANTDIFVTADHGFATISKHEVDAQGDFTKSYSTQFTYVDNTGRVEVNPGFLPVGFVAIDLAHALNLPLFDPDSMVTVNGVNLYEQVDPTIPEQSATERQHPASGNGLIGASGQILNNTDAKAIVAANGGSDLIYIPDNNADRLKQIVTFLLAQDYSGPIFVNDSFGKIAGTLPLSLIGLIGNTSLPQPAIALGFKTFYLSKNDLQSAVQIADSGLQEGQGMHGSYGRDNTFNNMAAIGPDFKASYTDIAPVSNADLAPTLARIMGLALPSKGMLVGRILNEALVGGPPATKFKYKFKYSPVAPNGERTVIQYQELYGKGFFPLFDGACLTVGKSCSN